MGGFFSSPDPPSYSPPAQSDPDEETRKQRLETMARNRRGLAGLVATSDAGVLTPLSSAPTRPTKTLLGE